MIKILKAASVMLAIVVLASCGSNGPKEVAHTWLTDFYHGDYEAAKKLSTEDTKAMLSQLAAFGAMMPDSTKADMKKAVITIKDVREAGDSAWVTYIVKGIDKDNSAPPDFPPLELVKQKGKWLVLFTKDQMTGGATDTSANGADTTSVPPVDSAMSADTSQH